MKIRQVTLALGSNLGDRQRTLEATRRSIMAEIGPITHASRERTTSAWGVTDQPDFLNQVVVARPDHLNGRLRGQPLSDWLHALLDVTQQIERSLGRERRQHWGPRTCDIDIIFVDRHRCETNRLSLPHPWWKDRSFVAGLMAEDTSFFLPFGS